MKKQGGSSAHGKQRRTKGGHTKVATSDRLRAGQLAELAKLQELPDDQIDTTDPVEIRDWSDAKRGAFYRPVKQQITLRIDSDVVDWFRSQTSEGQGYQTSINRALRDHVKRNSRLRRVG